MAYEFRYLQKSRKEGVLISDEDKNLLRSLKIPWSNDLGSEMDKLGIKYYHEAVIPELNADWTYAVRQALERHCECLNNGNYRKIFSLSKQRYSLIPV